MSVFHSNTERLIDYWRRRGGEAGLPTRMAVNPADFSEVMSQVFIAGRRVPMVSRQTMLRDRYMQAIRDQHAMSPGYIKPMAL